MNKKCPLFKKSTKVCKIMTFQAIEKEIQTCGGYTKTVNVFTIGFSTLYRGRIPEDHTKAVFTIRFFTLRTIDIHTRR